MERKIAFITAILTLCTVSMAVSLSLGRDDDQRHFSQKTILLEFAARLEEHENHFQREEHLSPSRESFTP